MPEEVKRILQLMEDRGIRASKLTKDVGLNLGAVTDWKKGKAKPSYGSVVKIADYFGVSTDYLLGIENNLNSNNEKKSPDALTTEDKLRLYFYEKTGREPTDDELCRLDDYVDIFIKAHQK